MKEVEDGPGEQWSPPCSYSHPSSSATLLRYIILLPPGVQDLSQFPIFLSFFLLFTVRQSPMGWGRTIWAYESPSLFSALASPEEQTVNSRRAV